jgi:uncharacterized protein (TIGR02391 family)
VTRKTKDAPPRLADLTPDQMKLALPKLARRLKDLREADIDSINGRADPRFEGLRHRLNSTLEEIFGVDTVEYNRYVVWEFDTAGVNMMYETPLEEVREGYRDSIYAAALNFETIIQLFEERLEDDKATPKGKALKALGDLELHPEIERAISDLFKGGHYANAVEDACKVLDAMVRLRSGIHDASGTELMQRVFSPKNPILRFNDLESQSDQSEQQGMMFLYSGAMLAFRNPRAHQIIEDDAEKALEYIGLLSLLTKLLDKTSRI